MPLPLILGIGAAVAGATGIGAGAHGAVKMKKANDEMKKVKDRHERAIQRLESSNKETTGLLDKIGKTELEILKSFEEFSAVWEKIQNKPDFKDIIVGKFDLPKYDPKVLEDVWVGAGVLLGSLGGAAMGTAGGFAAAGATTAAVMAVGTASTGTAIGTLSGAALTNATLAALGGGALAAGGGGMALGTTILGATTLGVGLLVGGIVFNIAGRSISNKVEEASRQVKKIEEEVASARDYLARLFRYAMDFKNALYKVNEVYRTHLSALEYKVDFSKKTDWNEFTEEEKLLAENTVLLVQLLYNMCKTKLVIQSESADKQNEINTADINRACVHAEAVLEERGLNGKA